MGNEEEKPTLCLGDGFRLRKPPSRWKGGLRETGGGTDPTSTCQSSRRGKSREGDFTVKISHGNESMADTSLGQSRYKVQLP